MQMTGHHTKIFRDDAQLLQVYNQEDKYGVYLIGMYVKQKVLDGVYF